MKRNEIEGLLPAIFQRTARAGGPLYALLTAMEGLQAPAEAVIEQLPDFFNPHRTPEEFAPYLACWVDLARILADSPEELAPGVLPPFASGLGRLRELIAAAAFLSRWRGSKQGLTRFLETATGLTGFDIDEQVADTAGQPRPFHVRVTAPKDATPYQALIRRIIEQEKPAYVTYELEFQA